MKLASSGAAWDIPADCRTPVTIVRRLEEPRSLQPCQSGLALRGRLRVLRLTGCGANCLECWLDDETGSCQSRYETDHVGSAADRVAVFFAAIRLLGISFLFRCGSGDTYGLWITRCQLVAALEAALFSQLCLELALLLH